MKQLWEKIMGFKNTKQIPVCQSCHIYLIHSGKYGGVKLRNCLPKRIFSNKLITIEFFFPVKEKI